MGTPGLYQAVGTRLVPESGKASSVLRLGGGSRRNMETGACFVMVAFVELSDMLGA